MRTRTSSRNVIQMRQNAGDLHHINRSWWRKGISLHMINLCVCERYNSIAFCRYPLGGVEAARKFPKSITPRSRGIPAPAAPEEIPFCRILTSRDSMKGLSSSVSLMMIISVSVFSNSSRFCTRKRPFAARGANVVLMKRSSAKKLYVFEVATRNNRYNSCCGVTRKKSKKSSRQV